MGLRRRIRNGFLVGVNHFLNPLTRRLARSSFGPLAVIRHVGRRSGKLYETPIVVIPVAGGFVIELTYGPDVDWHKNALAAGGCALLWHGQEFAIDRIEPLTAEAGRAAFPSPLRWILRALRRQDFEMLSFRR